MSLFSKLLNLTGLKYSCLVGLVFLIFFLPFGVKGADFSVAINEIAWMGTVNSSDDEWIELYNNTKNNLNLEGWALKSEDGSPEIKLTGIIPANGFYLLERTNDNAVPEIAADLIYKGALNNSGEKLKLYNSLNDIIDEAGSSAGWFSGDNATKKTMERINPLASGSKSSNWQTSQGPGGTPKTGNPAPEQVQKPAEDIPPLTEGATEIGTPRTESPQVGYKSYPAGIIFNELLPSPEGPDDEEEWIELFNQNSFEVDLFGWKIKDVSGKITIFTFPKETKISPQGFLVFSRPATKISLNNDGDGLVLLSPEGKIVDAIDYQKAPRARSYNKGTGTDWLWSANLTPGAPNITEKPEARPRADDSALETKEKRELAAIGEQATKSSKFLFVLLIALGIALSSGVILLLLKKKLKKDRLI